VAGFEGTRPLPARQPGAFQLAGGNFRTVLAALNLLLSRWPATRLLSSRGGLGKPVVQLARPCGPQFTPASPEGPSDAAGEFAWPAQTASRAAEQKP